MQVHVLPAGGRRDAAVAGPLAGIQYARPYMVSFIYVSNVYGFIHMLLKRIWCYSYTFDIHLKYTFEMQVHVLPTGGRRGAAVAGPRAGL